MQDNLIPKSAKVNRMLGFVDTNLGTDNVSVKSPSFATSSHQGWYGRGQFKWGQFGIRDLGTNMQINKRLCKKRRKIRLLPNFQQPITGRWTALKIPSAKSRNVDLDAAC